MDAALPDPPPFSARRGAHLPPSIGARVARGQETSAACSTARRTFPVTRRVARLGPIGRTRSEYYNMSNDVVNLFQGPLTLRYASSLRYAMMIRIAAGPACHTPRLKRSRDSLAHFKFYHHISGVQGEGVRFFFFATRLRPRAPWFSSEHGRRLPRRDETSTFQPSRPFASRFRVWKP